MTILNEETQKEQLMQSVQKAISTQIIQLQMNLDYYYKKNIEFDYGHIGDLTRVLEQLTEINQGFLKGKK